MLVGNRFGISSRFISGRLDKICEQVVCDKLNAVRIK